MLSGFHTVFLEAEPVADAVRRVAAAGYDRVELNAETLPWAAAHVGPDTDPAERRQLADLMPVSAISAHTNGLSDRNLAVRQSAVNWTIECVRLAADVGAPVVHVIPGDGDDLDGLYLALRRIVDAGRDTGIVVALEGIVNQLISTSEGVGQAIEKVPGLKVNLDPSHYQVTEGDAIAAAQRLAPHTVHVHIKDGRGSPDDFLFPPLGTGDVNFEQLIDVLADAGYDGVLSIEHESHVYGDTRGPDEVLAAGLDVLDRLRASRSTG